MPFVFSGVSIPHGMIAVFGFAGTVECTQCAAGHYSSDEGEGTVPTQLNSTATQALKAVLRLMELKLQDIATIRLCLKELKLQDTATIRLRGYLDYSASDLIIVAECNPVNSPVL
jgi:hypothetical protein